MKPVAAVRWRLAHIRAVGGWRIYLLYMPGPGPRLMSWLRKRWVIFRNPRARIEFHGPVYLGPGFSLHAPHGGTFTVGAGTEFRRGFRAELTDAQTRITVGGGCAFTYDVLMQCASSIEIGNHVMFGQATMIVDGNHRFRELDKPMLWQGYDLRPLKIADHVTVTTKCTIINSIGERSFIGANTVITRPVPPFCVVVGARQRIVEYFGPPGQEPPGWEARSDSSASTSG